MTILEETRALLAELDKDSIERATEDDAVALWRRLNDTVAGHDHQYYVRDRPLITDAEYDRRSDHSVCSKSGSRIYGRPNP